jgi:hypothetical protein
MKNEQIILLTDKMNKCYYCKHFVPTEKMENDGICLERPLLTKRIGIYTGVSKDYSCFLFITKIKQIKLDN